MAAIPELLRYLRISLSDSLSKIAKIGAQEVYISLTTTPDRIGRIQHTLGSLLDQSIPPKAIYLNLPRVSLRGEPYEIPHELKNHPTISIHRIEEDLGPASKSLPALKNPDIPSDALIVVLDDDQVYPKKLIENYLHHAEKHPGHVLTLCGWRTPRSLTHPDKKILRGAGLKIFDPKANIKENTPVEIIQGASSYAIKKSFFDHQIFDDTHAPKGALFADDIWISGHLARRKVPRMVVRGSFAYCRLEAFSHLRTKGLRDTANAGNANNDALYRYFENDWKLFS